MGIDTHLKKERYPVSVTAVATTLLQFQMNRASHLAFTFFNRGAEHFIPRPPTQGSTIRTWIEYYDEATTAWVALDAAAVFQDTVPLGKTYVNGAVNGVTTLGNREQWRLRAQAITGVGGQLQVLVDVDETLQLTAVL